MATYPSAIYDPRTKENKPLVVYDPDKTTQLFAEDIVLDDDEIVAIETELGTNPKGTHDSVKDRFDDDEGLISGKPDDFLELDDTPASYEDQAGKFVKVNDTEDGLEFAAGGGGAETFLDLTDTPASYASQAGKIVQVNGDEDALEFAAVAPPSSFYEPRAIYSEPASTYTAGYSDDWENVPGAQGATVNVYLHKGAYLSSNNGDCIKCLSDNIQTIGRTTLWAAADGHKGFMVQGGYLYWLLYDTGAHVAKIFRAATSSDISQAGNWAELTISGDTLSDTEDYLVGYGDGKFWICDNGTKYKTYTLSGTTLTYVADVSVTGSNYLGLITRVNDLGICATFSAAPFCRMAAFDGTLDSTRQFCAIAAATGLHASQYHFYMRGYPYSNYTVPWPRVEGL